MTSPDYLDTAPPLQNPTTASTWVPLWRIMEQLASAIEDSGEAEHYAKTRRYIRQVAVEGRLRIRGRHEIQVAGQQRTIFSEIYTEIPPAYWKSSVIDVLATHVSFEAARHTSPEKTPFAWGPRGLYEPNCYTGLQLNSHDLSQLIGDIRGTGLLADTRSISTETEALKFNDVVSLKPTLWGMSIDLRKVWQWLCERLHSVDLKQQAMPQFPKTASILNRLWRDPVWSKVIATGITAGIGVVWYFHIQNPPPPAATPTPAIPAEPPAVTQHQIPLVEKWMELPAAIEAFVPVTLKNAYDQSAKHATHLQEEIEAAQSKLVAPSGFPMAQGKAAEDLRYQIFAFRNELAIDARQQVQAQNAIILFVINLFKSGDLFARGYDPKTDKWVYILPNEWQYLQLVPRTGALTEDSMAIIGGLAGRTNLVWIQCGKPASHAM
jgi:hypothetical protein